MTDSRDISLNAIKNVISTGKITHVFNYNIYNEGNSEVGVAIRKRIGRMMNQVYSYKIGNDIVSIRWCSIVGNPTSCYYYTDSLYNDTMTAEHIKILLKSVVSTIKHSSITEMDGYCEQWGVQYLVTRVLKHLTASDSAGYIE